MNNAPIGIFDSGLGGLCAVSALKKIAQNENIIYLGDTGRVPYGTKSRDTLLEYAKSDIAFLKKSNVKIILAACGTISSTVLDEVKGNYNIPIFGVVDSAVKKAVSISKNKRVAIIGTSATISSGVFKTKISNIDSSIKTISVACPLFVSLVENGFIDSGNEITKLTVEHYLKEIKDFNADCLIMGCTHFPIIKDFISKYLPNVTLIDPSKEAIEDLKKYIENNSLISENKESGDISYFVTDDPIKFSQNANIFLGDDTKIIATKIQL